jgi:death-on-curing protein
METPRFIERTEVLFFHKQEIAKGNHLDGLRDAAALEAALGAPQAAFGGVLLLDLFEMAAVYVEAMCAHHPFLDGNKRTGAACALVFLYLNGYDLEESYEEELADKILALVCHTIDRHELAEYFRRQAKPIA